ncbi:MAG: transporter substrate-binding domain-containing protein [Pseudomonadota bacterium]
MNLCRTIAIFKAGATVGATLRSLARRCAAGAFMLAAGACAGAEPDLAKATGHPNWPPFSWQNGNKIVGIGPELLDIIFHELGIGVDCSAAGNWKRAQAQAKVGAVDIIVAAYLTEERNQYLAYPAQPFMNDANVVWVARERPFPFHKWEDLIGRSGTAMLGESYGEKFDRFIKDSLHIEWVSAPTQSLRMLDAGRVSYYPFSLYGGQIQVQQMGLAGRIVNLPDVISTEGTYIAISRKSRFLKYLPQIEAAMARLRADGTVERLTKKYVALAAQSAPP